MTTNEAYRRLEEKMISKLGAGGVISLTVCYSETCSSISPVVETVHCDVRVRGVDAQGVPCFDFQVTRPTVDDAYYQAADIIES